MASGEKRDRPPSSGPIKSAPIKSAPIQRRSSGTRPAVREAAVRDADSGTLQRELARLRRENHLLKSQIRPPAPIPREMPERGPAAGSLQPGDMVADRYQLERLLAKGGMGAVWVAHDLEGGEQVALKFLGEGAASEQISRFQREAFIGKRLASDHVVRVLSDGVDGGNHYIAMELLRGDSLSSLLRERERLTLPEVTQLVSDIRRALEPAHAAGVVHRDLKPQNLFLSVEPDGARSLKLLDFGVAKAIDAEDDVTQSGCIIGSPDYMSPEQARGLPVDHRSDLWSVAVILYRVLSGARPWEADNPVDLLLRICTVPPPAPSVAVPDLPQAIDRFFERAFAPRIEARFQSIEDLTATFSRAAQSPSVPPPLEPKLHGPVPSAPSLDSAGIDDISVSDSVDEPPASVQGSEAALDALAEEPQRPRWFWPVVIALALVVLGSIISLAAMLAR